VIAGGVGSPVGGTTTAIEVTLSTSTGPGSTHNHSVPGLSVPGLSIPGLAVPALTVPALGVGTIEMANLTAPVYFRR
jgi:hypothetical protein